MAYRATKIRAGLRSFTRAVLVTVSAFGFLAIAAPAQTTTFVKFSDFSLFSDSDQDPIQSISNRHRISAAILLAQEWQRSNGRLDFAVILGLGAEGLDQRSNNVIAREISTYTAQD